MNGLSLRRASLTTKDGSEIATVNTLPYAIMPEMLVWGTRYFVFNGTRDEREALPVTSDAIYREINGMGIGFDDPSQSGVQ